MSDSQSTHQVAVRGVDQTGAAFQSLVDRVDAASARIRKMLGGALAAAGAYLSFRAFKNSADELGHLSDVAMKSGTSVETLTKTALAFQVAGLDIPVDTLAKSFQYLQRATGENGTEAFYKAVRAIAAIEDPAKRGAETVRVFGRAGLELQPLINGGEKAIKAFQDLVKLMPGVSDAAANAGDAAADAMLVFSKGAQSIGLKVVGKLCQLWGDEFPGGVRAGALNAINWFEYALKKMYHHLVSWGVRIGQGGQALANFLFNGYSWDQAWAEYDQVQAVWHQQFDDRMRQLDKEREDYKAELKTKSADDLANAFGALRGRGKGIAESPAAMEGAAAARSPSISNALVMGGSNAARRMAVLGPQMQNETRKQTEFLKQIADNTKNAADGIEDAAGNGEVLNVIDG